MKSQRKSKTKSQQKGGECGNYTIVGELSPGIPIYGKHEGRNCSQRGGKGKVKVSRSKKRVRKQTSRKIGKKIDNKKIDKIIETLCKSIKRKCTPKYKKLLKKIVIKNL